jgi:hypothetical protein
MQSGYPQNGTSVPKIPYVITRSDFSKLYPVYQKMALALMQTGKVIIVDESEPVQVMPPEGAPSHCMKSPMSAPGGSSCATPKRARNVALSAGAEGAGPHQWGAACRHPLLAHIE